MQNIKDNMHISVSPIPYNAESRGAADEAGRYPPPVKREHINTGGCKFKVGG